jgi:AraC-like DNA-binding protein
MTILTHRVRETVLCAVVEASKWLESKHRVPFRLQDEPDLDRFCEAFKDVQLAVLDLSTVSSAQAGAVIINQLEAWPFTRMVVIPPATIGHDTHLIWLLLRLGKFGVEAPECEVAAMSGKWWVRHLAEAAGTAALDNAWDSLRSIMPEGTKGDLMRQISEHALVARSVKTLAYLMYPNSPTPDARRKRLWENCQRVGLDAPENVLYTMRLVMLKAMLDADTWPLGRVARHFGYESTRMLNRSCRNRYGVSTTQLRAIPHAKVMNCAASVFHQGMCDGRLEEYAIAV